MEMGLESVILLEYCACTLRSGCARVHRKTTEGKLQEMTAECEMHDHSQLVGYMQVCAGA